MKMNKKMKILTLCDHPLATSGVGVQAGLLIRGLLATGKYSFKSLGAAIKHDNYDVARPMPDFVIKPVDGFGTKEDLRKILLTERPDALFLFTDPRQFIWVWEMADEIQQICPITYWHVWDNDPYPDCNDIWYKSTDSINCLSHKTYELVSSKFPEKTKYIPHAFPKQMYYPLPSDVIAQQNVERFADKADWFKVLWVNRNATRKVPADVLAAFKKFLEALEAKHGHKKALLVMHTAPNDMEGPNLIAVSDHLNLQGHVFFSTEKMPPEGMNLMHNLCDTLINVAKAEGFGLSTLIHMMVGRPIIALKTGGMTRQVVDHRDGTEIGVAIEPIMRQLIGSQMVPYIYEDFASHDQIVDALMKVYEMSPETKEQIKQKALDYCDYEYNFENVVKAWDESLSTTIDNFKKKNKKTWSLQEVKNPNPREAVKPIDQTREVLRQNNIILSKEVEAFPIDITGHFLNKLKISKMTRKSVK